MRHAWFRRSVPRIASHSMRLEARTAEGGDETEPRLHKQRAVLAGEQRLVAPLHPWLFKYESRMHPRPQLAHAAVRSGLTCELELGDAKIARLMGVARLQERDDDASVVEVEKTCIECVTRPRRRKPV